MVKNFTIEQFGTKIERGIDDSELISQPTHFSEMATQLEASAMERLLNCKTKEVPEWLIVAQGSLSTDSLSESLEPTKKFLKTEERLCISAAARATAEAIAKRMVSKVVGKQFFEKTAAKTTSALSSKVPGRSIGSVIGSIGGQRVSHSTLRQARPLTPTWTKSYQA